MKIIKSLMGTLAAIASAALFASCSSEASHPLMESIPADATGVTIYNLDKLKDEGVEFTPVKLARNYFPFATGIAASAQMPDGITMSVIPAPTADALSQAGFTASSADGDFTPYTNADGLTVVVDSKAQIAYGIPMDAQRALERAKQTAAAASEKSLASALGLVNLFEQDAQGGAAIYGAYSSKLVGITGTDSNEDIQDAEWLAFSVKQESDVADLTVKNVKGSGKPVEIKGLQTIQPDFLRYVPEDMNVVAAVGLTPEINWDAAARLMGLVADRSTSGYFAAVMPYLRSIDGTVAIAVGMPADDSAGLAGGRFLAMAHMERSKINDVIAQATNLAKIAGAATQKVSDNITLITLPQLYGLPLSLYFGEVDGYLVISSSLPDGKAQNSYASTMKGHEASAVVDIAPGQMSNAKLPDGAGLKIRFTLDSNEAHAHISFPGAKQTPLAIFFN